MKPLMHARGYIRKFGTQWHYEASVGGVVYLRDDVCDFSLALQACLFDVAVLNRIYGAGHKLKHSFPYLVSRAKDL